MARTKSATLRLIIDGDPSGGSKAVKVISADVSGLTGKMKGLATAGGILFAGRKLVDWGAQAVTTYRTVGGEMLKLERLTGANEKAVSGLWVAAQQSGIPVAKLATSIGIFSSNLQRGKLDKLGIDLTDATGKAVPFEEALRRISDRVSHMADGTEKNDLVRTIFGRSGTDLIPLLNKGGDALDEFIAKAHDLGLELNGDEIKQATKNQRDYQLALTASKFVVGKELLPAVTAFTGFVARNLPPVVHVVSDLAHAVTSLPGPVKAVGAAFVFAGPAAKGLSLIATPLKLTLGLVKGGSQALGMFQLGLAGVTEKGAGAANAMGGFIASIGPVGIAAAATGLGLIAVVLTRIQLDSQHARQNVKEMTQQIIDGADPAAVAADRLAKTLAGIDGGFDGLEGSSAQFGKDLKEAGLSATDAVRVIMMSDAEFKKFRENIYRNNSAETSERVTTNLDRMRDSTKGATSAAEISAKVNEELGTATDDVADSTADATAKLDPYQAALDRATTAVKNFRDHQDQVRSAQDAVVSAHAASQKAVEDLATAHRAAQGDSDEYRDAEAAITDAEKAEADAAQAVIDARMAQRDALADLNRERVDAAKRIRDLATAERESRTAETGAEVDVERARKELERLISGGADPLKIKEARQAVREAEDAYAASITNRKDAEEKAEAAKHAGVEGDAQVVAAKARVVEANRGVVTAEQRVADAQAATAEAGRRATKVITDAKAREVEAHKAVDDALIDEAKRWGDLGEAQGGPIEGAKAYLQFLDDLYAKIDPNSPLAQRVKALMEDLTAAINVGRIADNPIGARTPRNPDAGLPTSDGGVHNARTPGAGDVLDPNAQGNVRAGDTYTHIETTVKVEGTRAEQLRNFRAQGEELSNEIARRVG